ATAALGLATSPRSAELPRMLLATAESPLASPSVPMMFAELPSGRPEPALDDYVRRAMLEIDGWGVDLFLAPVLRAIDRFQKLEGITANMFELGVHHGRCAVLFALMARPDETAVFVDLFERQDENIDASGRGSREIVERNLATWAAGRRIEVV